MSATPTESTISVKGSPDRRHHKRFRLYVPISVRDSDGKTIPAMTLEISAGGLSAVLASPTRVGGIVELRPVAAGAVKAQVMHNVGKVYGFEFQELTEDQVGKLRDICRRLPRYPPDNKMGV